jgi:phage gp36-like protein
MSRYATTDDLKTFGLPAGALDGSPIDVQKALDAASAFADSYLGARYTLPITTTDPALTIAVCGIAAWMLMSRRGFNPDNGSDPVIRQGYEDARAWLTRVANGQAVVQVVQAQPESLQPDLSSNTPRGYGDLIGDGSTDYPGVGGQSSWGV